MPTPAANLKKERLTLEHLTSYDDILTDALVDHVRAILISELNLLY